MCYAQLELGIFCSHFAYICEGDKELQVDSPCCLPGSRVAFPSSKTKLGVHMS